MPAPAVIPAPRAYINAVAVKGFVVELRVFQVDDPVLPCSQGQRLSLLALVNDGNKDHGILLLSNFTRTQCVQCGGTPVIFTVTKKA